MNPCDDPPNCLYTQEALEYAAFGASAGTFILKDYIGIDAGIEGVWSAFMGMSTADTNPNKTVIWSTPISYLP